MGEICLDRRRNNFNEEGVRQSEWPPLGITAPSAAKKTVDHYRQKLRAGDEMKNLGQWSGSGAGYGRPALAGPVSSERY
jgi:hypothetical protein